MVLGEPVVLGQVADPLADVGVAGRVVEQRGLAFAELDDAEQDLDERGLAGPVLAEQAEDFALLDLEGDAPQRLDAAVVLRKSRVSMTATGAKLRSKKGLEREDCRESKDSSSVGGWNLSR